MIKPKRKHPSPFPAIFTVLMLVALTALWVLSRPSSGPSDPPPDSVGTIINPVTYPVVGVEESVPAPIAPPAESFSTTVVTWNIEWFPGQSLNATAQEARTHMQAVQQAVREIDADIWLLQEMRDQPSVEELFMELPHEVHVVSGHLFRGSLGAMQTAIVSRFQAIDSGWENFVASDGARAPPRGFSWAVLDVRGQPLIVLTTHLKANPGAPARNIALREESARQMLAYIERLNRRYPGAPVVVGGDFNLLLNQPGMAHERTLAMFVEAGFHDGWAGVPFGKRVTWPGQGRYGDACFDYLLTRGLPERAAEVVTGWEQVSDHRPVRLAVGKE